SPVIYLKNRLDKRKTEVRRHWPTAMDLLLICVESGMSTEAAFRKVAEEMARESVVLSEELSLTTAELKYLPDRRVAYRRLAARTDVEEVGAIVTSLVQAEKYGTPMGQALRVLSRETRSLRMAAAEKKAAALPPKLTVPMIIFFLPVLFAVIMTPAIIQILQD
ncbi:MAG: type II secretion system F family protein, partial [Pseudomonadota bacterium]